MLKELFELIKENASETVINNPVIPNEHNNAVMAEATNTVASGLRNMVSGGGLQNILSLFGNVQQDGQANTQSLLSNPIVNMMIGHFSGKLMNNFGLDGSQASSVSNNLIPDVIRSLVNKTNDPGNNEFSIDKLLSSITGGQSAEVIQQQQEAGNTGFNLQDLVSQFSGNSQNGGSGGIMDIVSKLAGGAQAQQQRNGGGGLMDLIQGFLK